MAEFVSGERVGPFIVFRDSDGLRHAVRLGAVLAISDADDQQGMTWLSISGRRQVIIHAPLEDVLRWFA